MSWGVICCTAAKTSQRCPISQSLHPEIDFKLALEAVPQ